MEPQGIYPVLYAYFDDQGALDKANYEKQIAACLAAGAHGIATLGLITEVAKLTLQERQTLIDWTVAGVAGRVPVAVTVAGNSVEEMIGLAQYAEQAGADWIVLQPPLGEKPSASQLIRFFGQIMDAVDIPCGVQNAPEFLGCGLAPCDVKELMNQHGNFSVMKGEGPVVAIKPFIEASEGKLRIFNGRGGLELYDNLAAGCAGLIPAPDCADLQIQLYNAFAAGELEKAKELYHLLLPYAVYSMQSIDTAIFYGKRHFNRRAGIHGANNCRVPALREEPFFMEAGARWMGAFGTYAKGK
ncbi:dihydrodipicolinate synthase family protein [Polycladidibacter hongkongensis]|uniref:dihydrodipicolinate synthase family protein n=1 Tax=Polycladidibacter hongkongensis TaxID=1647556 RepID=UPI0008302285|nr:dihydrodipicolinate synthase family protein [Pseudovibrio hongkongensis]